MAPNQEEGKKKRFAFPIGKKEKQEKEARRQAREEKMKNSEDELEEMEKLLEDIETRKEQEKKFREKIHREFTKEEREQVEALEAKKREMYRITNEHINQSYLNRTASKIDRRYPKETEKEKEERKKATLVYMNDRVKKIIDEGKHNCKISRADCEEREA